MEALRELRTVVLESDISSFELNHSGLISALVAFLTDECGYKSSRDARIRSFIHVFADCPVGLFITSKSNQFYLMTFIPTLTFFVAGPFKRR